MEGVGGLENNRGYCSGEKSCEREMGCCGGHETNTSVPHWVNNLLYLSLTCHGGFIILRNM